MMFRKLQLQFLLTNLAIITVLFAALTLGAYFSLELKMMNHAEIFAKNMAVGINAGLMAPQGNLEKPPPQPHFAQQQPPMPLPEGLPDQERNSFFFYIKVNSSGIVFDHSINFPVRITQISQLARRICQTAKPNGVIRLFGSKYYYYQTALRNQKGTLLIFQDLRRDRQNQFALVISLAMIGGICMVLALLGSVFMARRAIAPIEKAWQQQKNFLADASHELRNPLAVIQTNLEVIVANPEESVSEQREWLDNIHDELEQMTALVNSLLFLARIDAHQRVMDLKRLELDKILTRVCEAFKPVMAAQQINLSTAIQTNVSLDGDEPALRQVVENLLNNAARHTPAGGTITVKLEHAAKKIILTVADTGEGIGPEHLSKIFDRFYQVDTSRSKGKSGLGLTIAKSIIENHGGTIQATSQPGVGTTFTIYLPAVKEAAS